MAMKETKVIEFIKRAGCSPVLLCLVKSRRRAWQPLHNNIIPTTLAFVVRDGKLRVACVEYRRDGDVQQLEVIPVKHNYKGVIGMFVSAYIHKASAYAKTASTTGIPLIAPSIKTLKPEKQINLLT